MSTAAEKSALIESAMAAAVLQANVEGISTSEANVATLKSRITAAYNNTVASFNPLSFSTGNRPTQAQFVQLNTGSIQYNGLIACWPMWEAQNVPIVDLKLGLVGNMWTAWPQVQTDNAMFGRYPLGGGNGAGGGTQRTFRVTNNTQVDMGDWTPSNAWGASFWFRTTVTVGGAVDTYLMSFSTAGPSPWAGSALSLDTGSTLAYNTNDTVRPDIGFKATGANMFNLGWHHCLFVQLPGTRNASNSTNIYFIDGVLNGTNTGCELIASAADDLFFLGTDQGDPPADGAISEWRYYRGGSNLVSAASRLALAQSLYNGATRWQLYLGNGLS